MMNKHAYLIIAHGDFYVLEKLVMLLDDTRNDIYIHIDKKVKRFDFDFFRRLVKKSRIYFTDRIDVRWGDFSQIQCELLLLKTAIAQEYEYYHLISGVDMPLKSNEEIHKFFDCHTGIEFVHFAEKSAVDSVRERVEQYHFMRLPFQGNNFFRRIPRVIDRIYVWGQKKVNVSREWDRTFELAYGTNWFSITHNFAEYVLSKERWIYQRFQHTSCADELFLQTILVNSKFIDNIYWKKWDNDFAGCMRHIDWIRGNPYVWRKEDFVELIQTDKFWARKFSSTVDKEIVDLIYNYLINEE